MSAHDEPAGSGAINMQRGPTSAAERIILDPQISTPSRRSQRTIANLFYSTTVRVRGASAWASIFRFLFAACLIRARFDSPVLSRTHDTRSVLWGQPVNPPEQVPSVDIESNAKHIQRLLDS